MMRRDFRAPLWKQLLPYAQEVLASLLFFTFIFVVLPIFFG